MTTAGPNSGSSSAGTNWANLGNLYTEDGSYASRTSAAATFETLSVYGFDFSSIPDDASIDGVVGRAVRWALSSSTISDSSLYLRDTSGNSIGSNKAAGGYWSTTAGDAVTYGGASDGWGASLTPSIVKNANFGVNLVVGNNAGLARAARVDYVSLAVYYTNATGQPMVARARLVPGIRRPHGHAGW